MMNRLNKVFNSNIKAIDESAQTLTALISTNAVDRMDEVLDPKGVDLKNFKKNPVVLWAHNYESQPVGKALWTKRQGDGIVSKIKFANTTLGQETFELYKDGFLSAFSVGFIPKAHEDEEVKGQAWPRRTYTEWELLEFSAVPVPANPEALALAMQKGIKSPEILKSFEGGENDADEQDTGTGEDAGEESEAKKTEETLTKTLVLREDTLYEVTKDGEIEFNGMLKDSVDPLDDLIADNDQLTKRIEAQSKELSDLRYKLYKLLTHNQKLCSEIAGKDLAQLAADVVARAIRRKTGKLD